MIVEIDRMMEVTEDYMIDRTEVMIIQKMSEFFEIVLQQQEDQESEMYILILGTREDTEIMKEGNVI